MSATLREVETTARQRQRRTRSRAVSHLEALAVSSLKPHEYDLHPESVSLVCPSCRTWVPIHVGTKAPKAKAEPKTKLVAHHTEKAGTKDPRRCLGSHRLIVIDVDIERWWQRLEEGVSETDGRRSNRVTRKPKVAVAPAVTQIVAPMLSTDATFKLFRTHARQCMVCQETGHAHCPEGSPLARLYLYKLRNAPAVTALARKIREEEENEGVEGKGRDLQWASTADDVRRADLQRVQDALEATLRQHSEKLNDWERGRPHERDHDARDQGGAADPVAHLPVERITHDERPRPRPTRSPRVGRAVAARTAVRTTTAPGTRDPGGCPGPVWRT